jgi:hypothetical protein
MTLDDKLQFLYQKEFWYQNKLYFCIDVAKKEDKFVVKTKQRSFVFFESEFVVFYDSLVIDNSVKPPAVKKVHNAVVMKEPTCVKVNEALMDMFEKISGETVDQEVLKKADMMVKISDAMVKNELLRLKLSNR